MANNILNTDMGEVEDSLDEYLWSWVNMGDSRVCDDCERLAKLEPASFTEWEKNRTEPGRGDTVCGDNCRCVLFPTDVIGVSPDMRTGEKIIIPDEGKLVVSKDDTYQDFENLDELIIEYKEKTGNKKLPSEYFDISSVDGRISFLKDWMDANQT